ncbi:MAG: IclR family transcriptional regulator [Pseudooceanicola atlanticus]
MSSETDIPQDEDGPGPSSIARALVLLRAVARHGDAGRRLSDLARETGLHKATAARLLNTLTEEGAVQRGDDKRYRMARGLLHALGLPHTVPQLRVAARPVLAALIDRLEDVALLSVRSGHDSLCIDRHVGRFPLQALSLDVGRRRPMSVGAGSMCLFAWLSAEERHAILDELTDAIGCFPNATPARLDSLAAETRGQGYSYLPDFVVPGMTGIGAPVRDTSGQVVAAVSIAAVGERLKGERGQWATGHLLAARDEIEARLRGEPPAARPQPDQTEEI